MFIFLVLAAFTVVQPDNTNEVRLVNNFLAARTEKCWTLDRLSRRGVVSCAATGVGFYAYAVAAKRGLIPKETAVAWIRNGFDAMLEVNPKKNCGWLYHFVDTSGKNVWDSEISSIDSVIFYASAEKAARLLQDQDLLNHILAAKSKIDLFLMTDKDGIFYHSFEWDNLRLIQSKWKWTAYNEGILIYKYFGKPFKTDKPVEYALPLFVFYYPLAFYEERQWVDHLGKAIDFQVTQTGRFGYTALDGQYGYTINSPYFVSPLAVYSCDRYFPDKVRWQLSQYNVDPLTPSMSINKQWQSQDKVMLDQGIALMLVFDERK